ncbi:ATP-grasp domain-containing protein [Thermodesulfobacteriota bacterium]
MLKIGFSYNIKEDESILDASITDSAAEYEEAETIDAIHSALLNISKNIVHLPCNNDFMTNVIKEMPDVVFNISEGYGGRNREGYAPTVYEMLGIPYTASDALSLSLTLDKAHTKRILLSENIPTPEFKLVSDLAELNDIDFPYPMFVKPAREGTSKGIRNNSKVVSESELRKQVAWVIENYRQPALVERFIDGREFASAVLQNEKVNTLPIIEVIFDKDKSPFFSYECKYNVEETLICPADMEDALKKKIDAYTKKIFKLFELRHLARIDLRVAKDGTPYILEVNALPGLSPSLSPYPVQAKAAGCSYDEMISEIMMTTIRENGL